MDFGGGEKAPARGPRFGLIVLHNKGLEIDLFNFENSLFPKIQDFQNSQKSSFHFREI
jgi:hypothetical protein